MAAKDFIFGNPSPEDEPNKYGWKANISDIMDKWRKNVLREATRADKEGVELPSMLDSLRMYVQPESFEPDYFVTYTDINKVGVNPGSVYNTPIGIYAYALDDRLLQQIEDGKVPFASNAKYISILKKRNDANLLSISTSSRLAMWTKLFSMETVEQFGLQGTEFEEEVRRIDKKAEEFPHDKYAKWSALWTHRQSDIYFQAEKKRKRKTDFAHIWLATRMVAGENPAKWNGILRYLGFDGAYDSNSGIIHRNEKSQAVFFSKEAINVIETMPNNMKKLDVLRKKRERGDYSGS